MYTFSHHGYKDSCILPTTSEKGDRLVFKKDNSREIEIIQANLTTFVEATKVNVVTLSDAINDLSEDVRRDIDSLCIAIGQLAEKLEEKKNVPVSRIGFKQASAQHQDGVTAG